MDSRLPAQNLAIKHRNTFELVQAHEDDFDELGLLRFQTGKATGGRPEKSALLNEDQAYLLLTYQQTHASSAVRAPKSNSSTSIPALLTAHPRGHARATSSTTSPSSRKREKTGGH